MSCRGEAWCPQCEQIITDSICMCAGVCDRHGQVCGGDVPDGRHSIRQTGREKPHSEAEYLRGWRVGYHAWAPGTSGQPAQWFTQPPGHPTKSAGEVWMDELFGRNKPVEMPFRGVWNVGREDRMTGGAGI